jgi:hypothetical protein
VQAINEGKTVSRSFLVQNLVRNTNINLAGIGITLIGLQASGASTVVCWGMGGGGWAGLAWCAGGAAADVVLSSAAGVLIGVSN